MSVVIEQPLAPPAIGRTEEPATSTKDEGANCVPFPVFDVDSDGDGVPDGWYVAAPRPALRPQFGLDAEMRRSGRWSATARGAGNRHCFGKWGQVVPVTGERWYRASVVFRAEGIEDVNVNLLIALVWQMPGKANRNCPTDHVSAFRRLPDGWMLGEGIFHAPSGCAALDVELYFRFAPHGTVWWDSVRVEEVAAPATRLTTLAAVRWRPDEVSTPERNLAQLGDLLDKAGHLGADLVCLPEMLNKGGRRDASYDEVAEELRGPTYQLLARKARQFGMYVLGCIYDRDGDFIFNTAFLTDRAGELVGTYRKVHLYWPEEREGVSPGDAFPVFQTDFGTVGVMICYDSWFPEVARVLGLKGAEVVLFPNAGYGEEQVLARPGDNAVYLVASAMNSPSLIATPDNKVLARTTVNGVVAATVDLNERGTAHPNAGGTLNASPGGRLASRHAPSLRLYDEIMSSVRGHAGHA
jgi:predicted amidohydrolase